MNFLGENSTAELIRIIKQNLSNLLSAEHEHSISEVTGLQAELDSKADSDHEHVIGDITELQDALDGKADASHTHSAATISAAGLMSAADKAKVNYTNIAYGTCSTAAATASKVIAVSGNTNWALTAGSRITIKFSATNTASNPTFNVNGTGEKSVWYNTAVIATSNLAFAGTANRPMDFVYDGTQYVFVGWSLDNNTTYSNQSLGNGYGTCSTAAATAAKVVTLSSYSLVTHGMVSVKFTYAVPASATMNINSKGAKAIFHNGAAIKAGVIAAGDIATFVYDGTQYQLVGIDKPQIFSAGTSAPANTKLLWIDTTASTGGLKYYNGSAWVHVPVAYT